MTFLQFFFLLDTDGLILHQHLQVILPTSGLLSYIHLCVHGLLDPCPKIHFSCKHGQQQTLSSPQNLWNYVTTLGSFGAAGPHTDRHTFLNNNHLFLEKKNEGLWSLRGKRNLITNFHSGRTGWNYNTIVRRTSFLRKNPEDIVPHREKVKKQKKLDF